MTSLLLKHKLLVNGRGALFTVHWESVASATWQRNFQLKRSRCVDDKYFSICSRHDSTATHA